MARQLLGAVVLALLVGGCDAGRRRQDDGQPTTELAFAVHGMINNFAPAQLPGGVLHGWFSPGDSPPCTVDCPGGTVMAAPGNGILVGDVTQDDPVSAIRATQDDNTRSEAILHGISGDLQDIVSSVSHADRLKHDVETKMDKIKSNNALLSARLDSIMEQPGETGEGGPRGPRGSSGPRGEMGPVGKWVRGPNGIDGPRGTPGRMGPPGKDGAEGPKGASGYAGPIGKDGPDGHPGAAGFANLQRGPPGPPGAAGAPGDQGPEGGPGMNGPDGVDGQSPRGPPGAPGPRGYQGGRAPQQDVAPPQDGEGSELAAKQQALQRSAGGHGGAKQQALTRSAGGHGGAKQQALGRSVGVHGGGAVTAEKQQATERSAGGHVGVAVVSERDLRSKVSKMVAKIAKHA
ncbi:hypothetical protein T484DRAFT_1945193 [Baffinella frigidus]|nr:hypothetical protein T484DRAFT_1945193 [Cryptophyta sp. CCMP2293]